ncbi:MAG TPA: DUF4214 domain-containing protein [Burkholderiaceae bacterium]|nr:DUF4214 domain-containing protein [Burkholderiaceae bacterium]
MATNTELVQQLYVAYYNRPADVDGLAFYVKALDAGATVAEISKNFATGPEYVATFAGMQNDEIIDTIYVNLFGRHADKTGLNFWGNELTQKISTLDVIVQKIAAGALNADGTLNADGKVYANKVAAAVLFTKEIDTAGNEQERVAYASGHVNGLAKTFLAGVTDDASLVAATAAIHTTGVALVDAYTPVTTTALTTAVDTLVGGSGNDVFNGTIGGAAGTDTLNPLDSIDGGAGNDTLNIASVNAGGLASTDLAGIVAKNVETVSIRAVQNVNVDLTSASLANVTGVTKLAVTQAGNAQLTAGATTNISISGETGTAIADGGLNETVTSSAGADVTLGFTTGAAGTISLTDTKQAATAVKVYGGTEVAVTSSGSTGGSIVVGGAVGGATGGNASGTVLVNSTGKAASGTAATSTATVDVTGGTKITVNQVATSDASAAATDTTAKTAHGVTQGAVTVTGDKHTTEVTVTQTAAAAGKDAVVAAAGSYQTEVQTFKDLASGKNVVVDGLTFTAAKDLTAAEVAAAFANIAASGAQGSGVVGNGTYTGALSANFASGAASGATVTFTATAKATAVTPFVVSTSGTALAAAVETAGADHTTGVTGVLKVVDGAVVVADSGDKVLTTVTLDGFGASSSVASDVLSTLNLANSNKDVTITNAGATNTTLALSLNGVGTAAAGATLTDTNGLYTTLNVTTATADSVVAAAVAGVTTLNIAGTNAVDLTGSTLTNLKTVTVTGAAGVTVDASGANVTAVDTSGTTGDSTVTVDGTKATFTGGAGVDTVTLSTTAPTKAIALGAGDDVLKLAATTTTIGTGGSLAGGDGTDTIVFATGADAAGASADGTFGGKISGFEVVGITTFGADGTVNLHNLDDISSVIIGGSTAGTLTLDKLVANSSIEFQGASAGTVVATLADATGTADVLNVKTNVADVATGFNILKAAGVETINLNAVDSNDDGDATTVATHTIDILATSAKSIVVTGNANVTLTADAANVKLASLDASALTGKLVAETNGTLAETIKGGAADDTLTANGTGDTLNGGAGADTLIVKGNLDVLTGGAGNDIFDVTTATNNVNSYATITDLSAGDTIQFANTAGTESFAASKVVLGDTAVFQDYANAAIHATAQGTISWFQSGGNTYIVENVSASNGPNFVNGTDIIVKLTGAVDLSHASFSADHQTLVFVS